MRFGLRPRDDALQLTEPIQYLYIVRPKGV